MDHVPSELNSFVETVGNFCFFDFKDIISRIFTVYILSCCFATKSIDCVT